MQPPVPVARMSAVRLVPAQVILARVTSVPLEVRPEAQPVVSARMTAQRVRAARTMLTQPSAAPTLLPPEALPPRIERPGQAKAPASMCCERP